MEPPPPGTPPSGPYAAPGGGGPPSWLFPVIGAVAALALVVGLFVVLSGGDSDDNDDAALVGEDGPQTPEDPAEDPAQDPAADDPADAEPGSLESGSDDPDYDPLRLTGTWEGTYDCGDGPMDLVLTLDDYPDETAVGGNWWFNPDSDNEGMYYLEGTNENGTLSMEPYAWSQDEGMARDNYEWHNLEADLSGFTGTEPIEATIGGDGCGDITLERTNQDPWYIGVFEGQYLCAQGLTGVTVTIEPLTQDTAYAFWEFYDIGESERPVPYGSQHMSATYSERSLALTLDHWERQPDGYISVDVRSNEGTDIHPNRFHGYLPDEESCGLIGMDRIDERGTASEAEEEDAAGSSGEGTS